MTDDGPATPPTPIPMGEPPPTDPRGPGAGPLDTAPAGGVCTTTEAARLLGVSNTTVQGMVERGELVAWKTRGGHRRISRASIGALREARAVGAAGRRAEGGATTLLVVEADPAARRRIEAAVAAWSLPVRLLWAADAVDALILFERHRPDVFVTDLHATPIDGFAFLRRLRAVPEYRATVFVVATALDDEDLAAHGGLPPGTVRYGAPVPLDTLRGVVEAWALRRSGAPR